MQAELPHSLFNLLMSKYIQITSIMQAEWPHHLFNLLMPVYIQWTLPFVM